MMAKALLWLGVAALLAANAWRWTPFEHEAPAIDHRTPAVIGYRSEDFHLQAPDGTPAASAPAVRNLFALKPPAVAAVAVADGAPAVAASPSASASDAPAPAKTAGELEVEMAHGELAQIKLAAVLVRGGRAVAYLVHGEQAYVVSAGSLAGRFAVEAVTDDEVTLRDPRTGVAGAIAVSGK